MEWWRRKFIIFSGFTEALIFSGCLFGWPSLLLILQEEGVYRDVCNIKTVHQHGDNNDNIYGDNPLHSFQESQPAINTLPEVDILQPFTTNESEKDHTTYGLLRSSTSLEIHEEEDDVIYRNCTEDYEGSETNCTRNLNDTLEDEDLLSGCDEQRVQMTLVYTFAAVAYGITAVFIGLSLEWLGLRFTRFIGSTLGCIGFVFLAFTTQERSYFLWPALNFIALGTNQLRLSGFQFADLWPEYRATILTAYSSAYSISTTFFLVIQLLYEQSVPMRLLFLCCGGICAATFIPTFFMPKMRIEIEEEQVAPQVVFNNLTDGTVRYAAENGSARIEENGKNQPFIDNSDGLALPQLQVDDDNQNQVPSNVEQFREMPTRARHMGIIQARTTRRRNKHSYITSLLSLSGIFHMYWHFINLFLVLFYSSTFNIWAAKVTSSIDDVSFYIKMSGFCCLIAPLFVPIIGIVTDKMTQRAERRQNRIERLAYTMQAPTFAMAGATILLTLTMVSKMFFTETAIYISLVLIAFSRPAVVGSCTAYIRLRFPADHFNILNGVFTTIISLVCFVQYPILKWMTSSHEAYIQAHWLLLLLLTGSLISPGHMMIRSNIIRYAKRRLFKIDE